MLSGYSSFSMMSTNDARSSILMNDLNDFFGLINNHGSPIFLRFGSLVVNSPTHSPKSIDYFLLTVKDKPCHLDQCNVHYITS